MTSKTSSQTGNLASTKKGLFVSLLIAAASGALMSLAFPPAEFAPAAWVSVIPLIFLCAARTKKRAFFYGFVWGLAWHVPGTFFLREINFSLPFVFAPVLALFNAVWATFIPVFTKNVLYPAEKRLEGAEAMKEFYNFSPLDELVCTFSLASLWIVLEWVRSWILTGFPWNLLAASQWKNLSLIQICEFTGIYGLSFLIILMNVAGYFAIAGLRRSIAEGKYKRPYPLLAAAVIAIFTSYVGNKTFSWRRAEYKSANLRPTAVGVVQPDLSQRRHGGIEKAYEALDVCTSLTDKLIKDDLALRKAISSGIVSASSASELRASSAENVKQLLPLEVIVWPETAVPVPFMSGSEVGAKYRQEVRELLNKGGIPLLFGTISYDDVVDDTNYKAYNSAVLIDKSSRAHVYSKVHLVPFGEFIPLNDRFPQIGALVGMGRNLSPGKTTDPLPITENVNAGVMICYEDVFPEIARERALNGADVLLVITNDAWYPVSTEPRQHFINSVFRAVETRLPMLRCGNSNYSVLIDPAGRIIDAAVKNVDPKTGDFVMMPDLKTPAAAKFIVPVPKKHTLTFYTRYGDVFVLFCALLAAIGLSIAFSRAVNYRRLVDSPLAKAKEDLKKSFEKR